MKKLFTKAAVSTPLLRKMRETSGGSAA